MNWSMVKDALQFATRMPSGFAILVGTAMVSWALWGHFSGFARADEIDQINHAAGELKKEVAKVKDDVQDGRIEALEGQLFQAKVQQCEAPPGDVRKLYAARVAALLSKYRELTDKAIDLPRCQEL